MRHRVVHAVHHYLLPRHRPGFGQEGSTVEALAQRGVGPDGVLVLRDKPQLGRMCLPNVDGEEVERVRELGPNEAELFKPALERRSGAAAHVDDQRSSRSGPVQQLDRVTVQGIKSQVEGFRSRPGALEEILGLGLCHYAKAGPGDVLHPEVGALFLQTKTQIAVA